MVNISTSTVFPMDKSEVNDELSPRAFTKLVFIVCAAVLVSCVLIGIVFFFIRNKMGNNGKIRLFVKGDNKSKTEVHKYEGLSQISTDINDAGENKDEQSHISNIKNHEWKANTITKEQSSKHNNKMDCWVIIDNVVYDITSFLSKHPGSILFIMEFAGTDCSEAMHGSGHSEYAYKLAESYRIGVLPIKQHTNLLEKQYSIINWKQLENLGKKIVKNENVFSVQSLNIYPVKGMKGIPIASTVIKNGGFLNDRMYCIIDADTNIVVNQLKYPKLCLIQPILKNIPFNGGNVTEQHKEITLLNTINNEQIIIPTEIQNTNKIYIKFVNSCTDILGYDQGKQSAEWITNFIRSNHDLNDKNQKFKFIKIQTNYERNHEPYFSLPFIDKNKQQIKGVLNYSSVNLASQESMDELNNRYKKKMKSNNTKYSPFNWNRFRVNIVIKGCPAPHFEDFCKVLIINNRVELLWNRRRYFCSVPNVDQFKGIQTMEPQCTLTRYRNAITLNDKSSKPGGKAVFFGSFFMIKTVGRIKIGDTIKTRKTQFNETRTKHQSSYYGGLPGMKSLNWDDDDDDEDMKIDTRNNCLTLHNWNEYKLIKKEQMNHDCFVFTFASDDKYKGQSLQLQPGGHWILKYVDNVNISGFYSKVSIIRAYTPMINCDINPPNDRNNYFQLLIKIYPDGRMTQHLINLQINDYIQATIKMNRIQYSEIGSLLIGDPYKSMCDAYKLEDINRINMCCGGTGITPMYQVLSTIHLNKQNGDNTKVNLFYASKTCKDILLVKQLNEMCQKNENINVWYIVGEYNQTDEKEYNVKIAKIGRIDKQLLAQNVYPSQNDTVTLLCGPDAMIVSMKKIFRQIGFTDEKRLLCFL